LFQKKNVNLDMKKNRKQHEEPATEVVTVPVDGLLTMVASLLKDRVLFPEKLESAKKFMANTTLKAV
jgi:hypothetical protein